MSALTLRGRGLRPGLHGMWRLVHGPTWLLLVVVAMAVVLAIVLSRRNR